MPPPGTPSASPRGCGRRAAASADVRSESLSRKIAEAHQGGVPWLAVVGHREVERSAIRLRARNGEQRDLSWEEAVAALVAECRPVASV